MYFRCQRFNCRFSSTSCDDTIFDSDAGVTDLNEKGYFSLASISTWGRFIVKFRKQWVLVNRLASVLAENFEISRVEPQSKLISFE